MSNALTTPSPIATDTTNESELEQLPKYEPQVTKSKAIKPKSNNDPLANPRPSSTPLISPKPNTPPLINQSSSSLAYALGLNNSSFKASSFKIPHKAKTANEEAEEAASSIQSKTPTTPATQRQISSPSKSESSTSSVTSSIHKSSNKTSNSSSSRSTSSIMPPPSKSSPKWQATYSAGNISPRYANDSAAQSGTSPTQATQNSSSSWNDK